MNFLIKVGFRQPLRVLFEKLEVFDDPSGNFVFQNMGVARSESVTLTMNPDFGQVHFWGH